MLSKPPIATFIPPRPAREALPYRAPYTVCGAEPAKGYWRQSCSEGTMAVPKDGAVQLPQNAVILGYEQSGGGNYVRYQVCRSVFVQTAPQGLSRAPATRSRRRNLRRPGFRDASSMRTCLRGTPEREATPSSTETWP